MSGDYQNVIRILENNGYKVAFVSVKSLSEIEAQFEQVTGKEERNKSIFKSLQDQYGIKFEFELPEKIKQAQSIIIAAMFQPKQRLFFTVEGVSLPVIIPPTYDYSSDGPMVDLLTKEVESRGFTLEKAWLPEKRLAVHSGLARYGKNNITYVEGKGSYVRYRTFFSDMPCEDAVFRDVGLLEACEKCVACIKKCPSRAIDPEHFMIDSSRCLTFFNEGDADFPDWIDPGWHHCLVGCMFCQDICPENKINKEWIVDGAVFDETETDEVLTASSLLKVSESTAEKLKQHDLHFDAPFIQRNLKVLLETLLKQYHKD